MPIRSRVRGSNPENITVVEIGEGGGGGPGIEAQLEWGPNFGGIDGDHPTVEAQNPDLADIELTGQLNVDHSPAISDMDVAYEDIVRVEGDIALNVGIQPADFPHLNADLDFYDANFGGLLNIDTLPNISDLALDLNDLNVDGIPDISDIALQGQLINEISLGPSNFFISAFNTFLDGSVIGNYNNQYDLINAESDILPEEYLADFEQYANAASAGGDWVNGNNSTGNTTSTFAELEAASSGLLGTTSNNSSGTVTTDFANSTITNFDLDGTAIVFVERAVVSEGTLPLGQSFSAEWEVSINGSSWNTIQSDSAAVAKGTVSLDITSLISGSWTNFNNLQVRCVGDVTSGAGVGATARIEFYRTWVTLTATKTSGF